MAEDLFATQHENPSCEGNLVQMEDSRACCDMDESMSNDDDIIINEVDGLPNVHPNYNELKIHTIDSQMSDGSCTLADLVSDEDLPTSIIVTNLDKSVFKSDEEKKKIEMLFLQFGQPATFQYFRSFRRMRVNYECPAAAAKARIHLHQARVGESVISCYFAQPVSPIDGENQHLHPPKPQRQFLISPPSSPPVGWEPADEAEPLVNYDLIAAIANLTPGGAHELHPPSENQPGIVVHICEEAATVGTRRIPIVQTACPNH